MKIAFLDRDGTIIKDYPDKLWQKQTEPEFLPHSFAAIRKFITSGYQIIIVTNQYLISDGIISLEQFEQFHHRFLAEMKLNGCEVLATYYCPHNDLANCACKKPKPGMINQALSNFPQIILEDSFYAGDSIVDIQLARQFNLKMYGIGVGENDADVTLVTSLLDIASG
ncbi:MAG: D-glycero-alpha-D-manno-heptose-1,7-bisphosphate 7-phosphatase [Culicoidibacterales bacterium]